MILMILILLTTIFTLLSGTVSTDYIQLLYIQSRVN